MVWNDDNKGDTCVRVCHVKGLEEWKEELKKRLQTAANCFERDRKEHLDVFALNDQELGERLRVLILEMPSLYKVFLDDSHILCIRNRVEVV